MHMNTSYLAMQCLQMAKQRSIDLIWRTANIEIAIPFSQVMPMLEYGESCNRHDFLVVNNIQQAWDYLFDIVDQPVDWQTICNYNRIIGQNIETNPGKARVSQVNISGTSYLPPAYTDLGDVFTQLESIRCEKSVVKQTCLLFAIACRQQWFDNANKRTALMIANHWMIQHGAGVFALPPERMGDEFRDKLITYYESGDFAPFFGWLQYHGVALLENDGLTQAQLGGADIMPETVL